MSTRYRAIDTIVSKAFPSMSAVTQACAEEVVRRATGIAQIAQWCGAHRSDSRTRTARRRVRAALIHQIDPGNHYDWTSDGPLPHEGADGLSLDEAVKVGWIVEFVDMVLMWELSGQGKPSAQLVDIYRMTPEEREERREMLRDLGAPNR